VIVRDLKNDAYLMKWMKGRMGKKAGKIGSVCESVRSECGPEVGKAGSEQNVSSAQSHQANIEAVLASFQLNTIV
jgi:hypothetical protein